MIKIQILRIYPGAQIEILGAVAEETLHASVAYTVVAQDLCQVDAHEFLSIHSAVHTKLIVFIYFNALFIDSNPNNLFRIHRDYIYRMKKQMIDNYLSHLSIVGSNM